MSNATIQEIEDNIRLSKETIEFCNSLARLRSNRDFKTVILTGYFEHEAIRLVHLKADQTMQSPELQKSIISQLDAIGALSQYFTSVTRSGAFADKSLDIDEKMVEELAAEELING